MKWSRFKIAVFSNPFYKAEQNVGKCIFIHQAASYACGCWAQNGSDDVPAVACSTSGCGEHLMRTLLAKECCDGVLRSDECTAMGVERVIREKFLGEYKLHLYVISWFYHFVLYLKRNVNEWIKPLTQFSASDLCSDSRVVRMWGSNPDRKHGAYVLEQDTLP